MLELLQVETSLIFAVVTYFVVLLCNKGAKESFSRNASLFYVSLAVIIGLGAVKLFYDSAHGLPMNYYSVMEVERHQNVLDIRRSYKTLSRRYHPDKNTGPDADLAFTNVKLAYDVLIDENLRDIYNRFGPRNLEFDPRKDEIKLMIDIATGFFFWGLFSYIVTLPTSWRGARSWIALLALVLLGAEVVFTMSGTEIPAFLHPTLTEYELIFYLNSAFPIVIVLLGASAQYFYMDMDATSISVLNDVVAHQKAMSEMMGKVEQILDLAKNPPSPASNQEAADCKDKIAELRDKLDEKSSAIAEKIKMLKISTTSLGGDYHWVVLVLVYGLIFYVGSS